MTDGERVRILVVCTGNVCRSPMAQAMLRQGLRERLGAAAAVFDVTSAGTGALVGAPMERQALDALGAVGVEAEDFAARSVSVPVIESADLILTATREHRAAVVTLVPSASQRTFTLREFARLAASLATDDRQAAGADVVERTRALVARVAGQRGRVPRVPAADDDIADPYRRSDRVFAQTVSGLEPCTSDIADLLAAVARG